MLQEIIPPFFHVADEKEIFCGYAKVDWPHFSERYCRRCNLDYVEANKRLAEKLDLRYEDLTDEHMAMLNEALQRYDLRGKELLREAGIEDVSCLSAIIDRSAIEAVSTYCCAG